MNTRRNSAAEEFTPDCVRLMGGFILAFTSILSLALIAWA